jgi:hypothetical protein
MIARRTTRICRSTAKKNRFLLRFLAQATMLDRSLRTRFFLPAPNCPIFIAIRMLPTDYIACAVLLCFG